MSVSFERGENKNKENLDKHSIGFHSAEYSFLDQKRIIAEDTTHSEKEKR